MSASVAPRRLRGTLRASPRGFLLECDDGHVWRIEGAEPFAVLADQPVIVEAYPRDASHLDLLWAGPAA